MEHSTKEISKKAKKMGMEFSYMRFRNITKEDSKRTKEMGTEFIVTRRNNTKENGKKIFFMGMES